VIHGAAGPLARLLISDDVELARNGGKELPSRQRRYPNSDRLSKRVASVIGEGTIAVAFAHQVLQE
jgi:hypothetical protein